MPGSRSFKVEWSSSNATGGRYKGDTPEQAAKKAGRQLFKRVDGKVESIKFTIVETTLRSNTRGKMHTYMMKMTQKKKPVVAVRGGVEVTYNYDYTIQAIKAADV
jgi:hypothetical protein